MFVTQRSQLLRVVEHGRMQRQTERHWQENTKRQTVQMLRHDGGYHSAPRQAVGKARRQQFGFMVQTGNGFDDALRLPRRAGGKQLDICIVAQGREEARFIAERHC
ncbi:hypothetical protein SDC9_194101 [bioreactor metagenome]|uniref:Uncharacterized protein n=1 Tax=bioreactor metagenome TaxID=1076179 RepID=A0A645I5D1_9ZZZZ